MRGNARDLGAGVLFVAIGLFFGIATWSGLRLGTARAMGPGFFPAALSLVLIALGLAIGAGALAGKPIAALPRPSWRGIALVTAAIVYFAATVRGLGMGPALAGATLLASLATDRNGAVAALALSLALTAFCLAIFVFALGLPYPVLGPWLVSR